MRKKSILLILITVHGWLCYPQMAEKHDIREEVYLHTNGTEFLSGETLFFSAYVRSARTGKLSPLSRILYMEILDSESKSVYQTKIKLVNGKGKGDYFVSSLLSTGNYHLMAYTRWMKNFNDYFHLPITIINPFESYTPPSFKDESQITLRFFPEGGVLLAGEKNLVGIAAFDPYGIGKAITGRVVDQTGNQSISFSTDHSGLGMFEFIPKRGELYKAIVENDNQEFLFFDLPENCDECVQLRVTQDRMTFMVEVRGKEETRSSQDSNEAPEILPRTSNSTHREATYHLIIQDGQINVYHREVRPGIAYPVDKRELPEGLLLVALQDQQGEILNERLIYNGVINKSNPEPTPEIYGFREKVSANFSLGAKAEVSVSVRKYYPNSYLPDLQKSHPVISSLKYLPFLWQADLEHSLDKILLVSEWRWEHSEPLDSVRFLPEFRFDLIEGKVYRSNKEPASNVCVSLAIPRPNPQVQLTRSDQEGKFLINIDAPVGDREGFLKVLGEDDDSYEFRLTNEYLDKYPDFKHYPAYFDSVRVAHIVRRSVNNQIENAYYQFHQDSLIPYVDTIPQFEYKSIYVLDDYTRFPTLRDTFIEYVPEIAVKKNENNFELRFRLLDVPAVGFEPGKVQLLLMDGIPVSRKQLLNYSPYNVAAISVINKRFQFGPVICDGIMSLTTFGEKMETFSAPLYKFSYKGVQPYKKYFTPNYAETGNHFLPDKREQLYWNPEAEVGEDGNLLLEFYTSDVPGRYVITAEGVLADGKPVSLREYFEVKESNIP